MKKILTLIILLTSTICYSQKAGRIFTVNCGLPVNRIAALDSTKDYLMDSCATYSSFNLYSWKKGKWSFVFSIPKAQGKTVTDAMVNSSGDLLISYSDGTTQNAGHVKGDKGDKGDPGTGGVSTVATPEQFGACHCSTGNIDQDALQRTLDSAGTKLVIWAGKYYVNKKLKVKKLVHTKITGNWELNTTNSLTYDVIGYDAPIDINDANVMQSTTSFTIDEGVMNIQGGQTAIQLYSMGNVRLTKIEVHGAYGLSNGFKLNFCLVANLSQCIIVGGYDGFQINYGGFPQGDMNNSQGNYTILEQCHTHSCSHICFGAYHSYGVRHVNCIAEGNQTCFRGFDFDCTNNTTVKEAWYITCHFEQIGGATDAVMNFATRDGVFHVWGLNVHYNTSCVIAATSQSNGVSYGAWLEIAGVSYLPGTTFFRSNSMFWCFWHNPMFNNTASLNGHWDTTRGVAGCSTQGCGWNYYDVQTL